MKANLTAMEKTGREIVKEDTKEERQIQAKRRNKKLEKEILKEESPAKRYCLYSTLRIVNLLDKSEI